MPIDFGKEYRALLADLNSFVEDHCARQKIGGLSLKYFIMKQLPLLPPERYGEPCSWTPADRLDVGQTLVQQRPMRRRH